MISLIVDSITIRHERVSWFSWLREWTLSVRRMPFHRKRSLSSPKERGTRCRHSRGTITGSGNPMYTYGVHWCAFAASGLSVNRFTVYFLSDFSQQGRHGGGQRSLPCLPGFPASPVARRSPNCKSHGKGGRGMTAGARGHGEFVANRCARSLPDRPSFCPVAILY